MSLAVGRSGDGTASTVQRAEGAPRHLFIDGLRGVAAAFVVVSHLWSSVFPHPRDGLAPVARWTAFLGLGRYAVSVFIVVSGVSLGLVVQRSAGGWPGGMRRFWTGRFLRIVPAYWVALAIGCAAGTSYLSQPSGSLWDGAIPIRPAGVVSHLLLLQDVVWRGPAGSTAFWSLAVEWHLYLIFPLVLLAFRRVAVVGAAYAAVLVLTVWSVSATSPAAIWARQLHPSLYGLFLIGFWTACAPSPQRAPRSGLWRGTGLVLATVAGLTAAAACTVLHGFDPTSEIHDLWIGPAAGVVIAAGLSGRLRRPVRLLQRPSLLRLGAISYSLYLIHPVVIETVWRYAVRPAHLGAASLAVAEALGLAAAVAAAAVFYRIVERPFHRLARRATANAPAAGRVPAADSGPAERAPDADGAPAGRTWLPSLDGIRAACILLVIWGHTSRVPHLVRGSVGVTAFFFVSGLLITGLLRREHDRTGSVSLAAFYRRRAVRILPALVVVVPVAAVISAAFGLPGRTTWGSVIAAYLQVENYWILSGHAFPQNLQMLWSLGVEEHFYLVFPLMYLTLMRLSRRRAVHASVLAGLCVLVLVWRVRLAYVDGVPYFERIYMASDTRADGILWGAVAAVTVDLWGRVRRERTGWAMRFAVPVLLVALFVAQRLDDRSQAWSLTLQSVSIGAVTLLVIRRPSGVIGALLNCRPMVFIGRISYPMYLVHQTVILSLERTIPALGGPLTLVVGGALSTASAWLLHAGVERPVARWARARWAPPVPAAPASRMVDVLEGAGR